MAVQFSVLVRNNRLDSFETTTGGTPILRVYTGAPPANCAAAAAGTLLAEITLPANWMAPAAGGSKAMLGGPWTDLAANNPGVAGHFRVYENTGVTCHMQGTVSLTGGGGDMQFDNTTFIVGQAVNIISFTLTSGNA